MMTVMNPDNLKTGRVFKTVAMPLIMLSLLVQLAALALDAGYWRYQGLADSQGNRVGFNNPLTREHIGLLINRASVADVAKKLDPIHASILMAHGLALILLFPRRISWFLVTVFGLTQIFALVWGTLGILMLLSLMMGHGWTGESIVEGPLSTIAASGTWFVVSCVLGAWLILANKLWLFFRREQIPEQTV